jgi:ABC-type oligopeptide transport system substrate-binding subunit
MKRSNVLIKAICAAILVAASLASMVKASSDTSRSNSTEPNKSRPPDGTLW